LRAFYLVDALVDQQLTDVLSRFDRQLAAQQALVDRFSFISPAIVANEGMASLAGNGTRRYERFKQQVIGYHESWKSYFVPRVLNGIAIVETDFERFPRWSWQEENAATHRAGRCIDQDCTAPGGRRGHGAARGMAVGQKAVGVGIAVRRLIATLSISAESRLGGLASDTDE
jgi:hypothetical protein